MESFLYFFSLPRAVQKLIVFMFQWRTLPDSEKQVYEDRAKRVNEENAIKFQEEQRVAEER